ncbi:MAG: fibronectin/fibrinogen-binding protein, partial [Eubacterium sp.]|nr:fibronectin/fibrinogen-binding protein [Eubacterium sp.]
MAYDGFMTAAITAEAARELAGSYISKIIQPEKDAVLLTFKTSEGTKRLFLSADASLPLVYMTEQNRKA